MPRGERKTQQITASIFRFLASDISWSSSGREFFVPDTPWSMYSRKMMKPRAAQLHFAALVFGGYAAVESNSHREFRRVI